MVILNITQSWYPKFGGVQSSIMQFSKWLRKRNNIVYILCPHISGVENDDQYTIRFKSVMLNKNDSVSPPMFFTNNKYIKATEYLKLLNIEPLNEFLNSIPINIIDTTIDKIKNLHIDIIHAHFPFNIHPFAVKISRTLGKPLISTHHTIYNFYKHHIGIKNCLFSPDALAVSQYNNGSNCIIVPTYSVRNYLQSYGCQVPISIIPSGVDTFVFHPITTIKKETVIGTAGRIDKEKNMLFFCTMMSYYLLRNIGCKCMIAGDGPLKKACEDIFSVHSALDGRVIFTGKKDHTKMAEFYNCLDIFVMTSESETQGLVINEAQACGVPVIGFDCTVNREVIGEGGLTAYTEADFIDAIDKILKKWEFFSHKAIENSKKYSIESCGTKLLSLYNSMLA